MISKIFYNYELCDYDLTSNPLFKNIRFSDNIYNSLKFKYSIAKSLNFKKYLEFRFTNNFSPVAFLDATPSSEYLSFNLSSEVSNDSLSSSISRYLKKYKFKNLSNQNYYKYLKNQNYDLVHIECGEYNSKFYELLFESLKSTDWILVSNYYEDIEFFHELNHFLRTFNSSISFHINTPHYNNDILIRINKDIKNTRTNNITGSSDIVSEYDSHYYLNACGGCHSFQEDGSLYSSDPRILNLLAVVSLFYDKGNLLDLGCGRGEVCLKFAMQGFTCTGVDYSKYAIEIANNEKYLHPKLSDQINYILSSITTYVPSKEFDVIVASDVIEHMTYDELSLCYKMVANALSKNGIFVVHTFPNSWYYDYHYSRKKRKVNYHGGYIPSDPRSKYEKLMHINEQNPRVLRKQLEKNFKYVTILFNSPNDPIGNFSKKSGHHKLSGYRDLYALASNRPIKIPFRKESFSYHNWNGKDIKCVSISIIKCKDKARTLEFFDLILEIKNNSNYFIHSLPPNPINISYHWIDHENMNPFVFDGLRTPFSFPVKPRSIQSLQARCQAPCKTGLYLLRFSLVQEQHAWFDQDPFLQFAEKLVKVTL